MPVPKKRQSKSRKNTRKFQWKQEASKQTNKAFSKAKVFLKQLLTENKTLLTENKTEDNEKTANKTEDNEKTANKTEDNEKTANKTEDNEKS